MTRIIDLFETIATAQPDAPALQTTRVYSYAELRDNALRFAAFLNAQNINQNEPRIVLNLSKSAAYIIGVLGCFYAGWAFTPLDPSLPQERKDFILQDIAPHLIISADNMTEALSHSAATKITAYPADTLAYIIYTSGSTGQPKGVMVEHKGLPNVIRQQITQFEMGTGDNSFLLLSISFDASLSDIFCTLLSGACLHIQEGNKQLIASDLPKILCERHITHIDIPPSMLRILNPEDMPSSLRSIIIGGEICGIETVKKWADSYILNNVYGPTEASICTSMIRCHAALWDRPLIGHAMDNVDYKIENEELLIGGIQLARGYWKRDDLTAEKFISLSNQQRFYRTGDHVKQHKDGQISFLGRLDRQVKIRGQLVELEEVEQHFLKFPTITRGTILTKEDSKGKKQLFAFYESAKDIPAKELTQHMARSLAEWMVPSYFIRLDALPLTASGKIDGKKLKHYKTTTQAQIITPQTSTQQTLWRIWQEILKRNDFGITESFFALGGDSVDAIDFTLRAAKQGLSISPSMLSKHFTIETLSAMLASLSPMDQGMSLDELRQFVEIPTAATPLGAQHGNAIFITGATGFLGGRLLRDLLRTTDKTYLCLVRCSSQIEGYQRLNLPERYKNRVKIICGDLTQQQFGLTNQEWLSLCTEIRSIIHCAAVVNMVKSFDDLRFANFDACLEIIRLAFESGAAHIDYISTLSVFVSTDQNTGCVYEHDMLNNIGHVYGGYAQSKVTTELAFHDRDVTSRCPVTSYRLGLITGDTQSGQGAPHDFLTTFVRGIISLGVIPVCNATHFMVDVTPVDYASHCLTRLITAAHKADCYHIANKKGFSLAQIISALKHRGIDLQTVSALQWENIPKQRMLLPHEQAAWLGLCRALGSEGFTRYRSMDLFQATDIFFDTTRLQAALPDIPCPAASNELLDIYLDNMI